MIFTRVTYSALFTDRLVYGTVSGCGHTPTTRRDLAAWNEANHEFWRWFRSGILDQTVDPTQPFYLNNDRLSLACSSWFFVTNNMYQGPTAVAHGL